MSSDHAPEPSGLLRWGIIGPGEIAARFADGIAASATGILTAAASRDPERAGAFLRRHAASTRGRSATAYGSYDALLADDEIDAVYVATTHPQHLRWAVATARAGKHLLVEKPAGLNHGQAAQIFEAAAENDVFAVEAYVYRFHEQTRLIAQLVADNAIGRVLSVEASFAFEAPFDPSSRLFDRALAGGGILDVGGYPVTFAAMVAGAALAADGEPAAFAAPTSIRAGGVIGESGVDEWAVANLQYESGMSAHLSTGVGMGDIGSARILGTAGRLEIPAPWLPREGEDAVLRLHRVRRGLEEITVPRGNIYAIEVDEISAHLEDRQSPSLTWADSLASLAVMDSWREQLGLRYDDEKPAAR